MTHRFTTPRTARRPVPPLSPLQRAQPTRPMAFAGSVAGTSARARLDTPRPIRERLAGGLHTALAALTIANSADLFLTVLGVRQHGQHGWHEVNPLLQHVFVWGGVPAFVGVKLLASVAEVLVAYAIWQYLKPETRGECWMVLGALWLGVGWLLLVDAASAAQLWLLPALPSLLR